MNTNNIFKAFALVCLASAVNSLEYPGDTCCRYWKDKDFGGESDVRCMPTSSYSPSQGDFWGTWYQTVESIFCGKNVDFEFKSGNSWQGLSADDIHGAGYYANGNLGLGANTATNYKLKPYDASEQGALTFFDSEDCTGRSGRVYWDKEDTMLTLNDFQSHGVFFKESISSVYLPKGYVLEMWTDAQFQKSKGVLTTQSYLNENEKVACLNIPDDIKSYEIRKDDDYKPAEGRWVQSRYNGDINQTMSTGVDSTTDKDREEVLREIRASLQAGFTFGADSLSSDLSSDEERTVMQSALQRMPKTQTVLCEAADSDEKAALYQWVVEAGEHTIWTDHFICRSGASAWKFPKCADSACKDAQCDQCIA